MDGFRYDVHLMSQSVPQEFLDELYAISGNRVSLRYLIEQLEKTGVTVVAGSGISVKVGYPRWSNLRRKLGQMAGIESPDPTPDEIIQAAGELFLYDALEENYRYPTSDPSTWRGPDSDPAIPDEPHHHNELGQRYRSVLSASRFTSGDGSWRNRYTTDASVDLEDVRHNRSPEKPTDPGTEYDRYRNPLAPVMDAVGDTALLFLGQPYPAFLKVASRIRTVTGSQATAYAVVSAADEIDAGQLSKCPSAQCDTRSSMDRAKSCYCAIWPTNRIQ